MVRNYLLICLTGLLLGLLSLAWPATPAAGATPTPTVRATRKFDLSRVSPSDYKKEIAFGGSAFDFGEGQDCRGSRDVYPDGPALLPDLAYLDLSRSLPPTQKYPVCACGYEPDQPLRVTLLDPQGQARLEVETAAQPSFDEATGVYITSCYSGEDIRRLAFLPDDPPGPYTVEIDSGEVTLSQGFELAPPAEPVVYYAEQAGGYVLAGFDPLETVNLLAFRYTRPDTMRLAEFREGQFDLDETGSGFITGADPRLDILVAVRPNLEIAYSREHQGGMYVEEWPVDYDQEVARDPANPSAYLQRALHPTDPGQVLADLNTALDLDPGLAPAYLARANYYANIAGSLDAALADLDQAVALAPDLPAAYAARAGVAERLGRWDVAAADYTRLIELEPGQGYWGRAQMYAQAGQPEAAIADYSALIELAETAGDTVWDRLALDPAPVYLARGKLLADAGDYERAAGDLRAAVERDYATSSVLRPDDYALALELAPDFALAYLGRGRFNLTLDPAAALADFEAAAGLDPGLVEAHDQLGRLYASQGRLDEAIAQFSQVLELRPAYLPAYYRRGQLYEAQGQVDLALADYSAALAGYPSGSTGLLYQRARLYDGQGQTDAAAADYRRAVELENPAELLQAAGQKWADFNRAVELNPDLAPAYYWRGQANGADPAAALADFSQAISLDPAYLPAYQARVRLYESGSLGSGYEAAAIDDYSRIIELAPAGSLAQVEAIKGRAGLSAGLGYVDEALADYSRLVELAPEPAAYYARARLYDGQGQADQAAADFKAGLALTMAAAEGTPEDYNRAAELLPDFAPAFYWRGERYCLAGDPASVELALADFNTVLSLGTDPRLSARAEQRLNQGCE